MIPWGINTCNGKELQEDLGLQWYAYGFRYYDPATARFPSADPKSEEFAFVSPYNYAENSPIANIDLWGLQKAFVADGKLINRSDHHRIAPPDNAQYLNGVVPSERDSKLFEASLLVLQAIDEGGSGGTQRGGNPLTSSTSSRGNTKWTADFLGENINIDHFLALKPDAGAYNGGANLSLDALKELVNGLNEILGNNQEDNDDEKSISDENNQEEKEKKLISSDTLWFGLEFDPETGQLLGNKAKITNIYNDSTTEYEDRYIW